MRYVKYKDHYIDFRSNYSPKMDSVSATYAYSCTEFKHEMTKYQLYSFIHKKSLFNRYMNNDIKIVVD